MKKNMSNSCGCGARILPDRVFCPECGAKTVGKVRRKDATGKKLDELRAAVREQADIIKSNNETIKALPNCRSCFMSDGRLLLWAGIFKLLFFGLTMLRWTEWYGENHSIESEIVGLVVALVILKIIILVATSKCKSRIAFIMCGAGQLVTGFFSFGVMLSLIQEGDFNNDLEIGYLFIYVALWFWIAIKTFSAKPEAEE